MPPTWVLGHGELTGSETGVDYVIGGVIGFFTGVIVTVLVLTLRALDKHYKNR